MHTLRSFSVVLLCFFLVFFPPSYSYGAEVYEITESELNQLEMNSKKSLEALQKAEKDLEKYEMELLTQEEQLKKISESLKKSERDQQLIIKIGIPAVIVVVAGAFVGGIIVGTKIPP